MFSHTLPGFQDTPYCQNFATEICMTTRGFVSCHSLPHIQNSPWYLSSVEGLADGESRCRFFFFIKKMSTGRSLLCFSQLVVDWTIVVVSCELQSLWGWHTKRAAPPIWRTSLLNFLPKKSSSYVDERFIFNMIMLTFKAK